MGEKLEKICNDRNGYVVMNKSLLWKIGLHQSLLIGELCSKTEYWLKQNKLTSDGFFYISREDIERDTGLSKHQQRKVCEELKSINLIECKKLDTKGVNYYKVNDEVLDMFIENKSNNVS